jgi:2-hydroxy-6-oxonona-2,4-dienedioate hydrolase
MTMHGQWRQFRWLERGEGDPIVLLHGLMGQMHHWDSVLDGLAEGFRGIAPQLPVFEPALPATSIDALAEWTLDFLDELEIGQAVLGGNSLGGHVALAAALHAPARVAGLVLTGSSGLFERSFTRGVPHRPTTEYVREKMEEIFYDRSLVTPEWVDAVHTSVLQPATALRVLRFARAAKRDNLEARLGEIKVPTLIVWGRDDRITPLHVAERFHALIPRSQLIVLRQCGHAPMLERPEAFGAVVRAWWEEMRLTGVSGMRTGGAR